MKQKKPLRRIVSRETWQGPNHTRGAYTTTLKLECGHEQSRKASAVKPMQRHARCWECLWRGKGVR